MFKTFILDLRTRRALQASLFMLEPLHGWSHILSLSPPSLVQRVATRCVIEVLQDMSVSSKAVEQNPYPAVALVAALVNELTPLLRNVPVVTFKEHFRALAMERELSCLLSFSNFDERKAQDELLNIEKAPLSFKLSQCIRALALGVSTADRLEELLQFCSLVVTQETMYANK